MIAKETKKNKRLSIMLAFFLVMQIFALPCHYSIENTHIIESLVSCSDCKAIDDCCRTDEHCKHCLESSPSNTSTATNVLNTLSEDPISSNVSIDFSQWSFFSKESIFVACLIEEVFHANTFTMRDWPTIKLNC